MATNATVSTGGCLPFSARYVKEVQTDAGARWSAKMPIPSVGIKKSKEYSLGRYPTQAAAIFAAEKFLDDAATFAKQSRQLNAGKNARCVMLLKCKNLALRMKVEALEGELAFQSKAAVAAVAAVEEAKKEGSAAFDLAMETAGEEQEEDAARLAACEEEIARQKHEIADLKCWRASSVWNRGAGGGVVQGVTGRTAVREARRKAAEEGWHWAAASFDAVLENHDDEFRPDEIAEHGDALEKARQERGKKMKAAAAVKNAKEGRGGGVCTHGPNSHNEVCVRCGDKCGSDWCSALDSAGHCVLCVSAIKIKKVDAFGFDDDGNVVLL